WADGGPQAHAADERLAGGQINTALDPQHGVVAEPADAQAVLGFGGAGIGAAVIHADAVGVRLGAGVIAILVGEGARLPTVEDAVFVGIPVHQATRHITVHDHAGDAVALGRTLVRIVGTATARKIEHGSGNGRAEHTLGKFTGLLHGPAPQNFSSKPKLIARPRGVLLPSISVLSRLYPKSRLATPNRVVPRFR